ncbi:hypothetical protein [Carbonactinospora thermoautotrophica]|nr:hypothetical protein [Carbonactinospora thermoautotrophica]
MSVSTYDERNRSTRLGYLKSSNLNNKAPIFGVRDHEVGFVSQADHGYMGVTLSKTCRGAREVAAAFDYEANQGGSVMSVSAGWGGLSVSYSNQGLTLQKGTNPIYWKM